MELMCKYLAFLKNKLKLQTGKHENVYSYLNKTCMKVKNQLVVTSGDKTDAKQEILLHRICQNYQENI